MDDPEAAAGRGLGRAVPHVPVDADAEGGLAHAPPHGRPVAGAEGPTGAADAACLYRTRLTARLVVADLGADPGLDLVHARGHAPTPDAEGVSLAGAPNPRCRFCM